MNNDIVFVNFWRRLPAKLLDWVLNVFFISLFVPVFYLFFPEKDLTPFILLSLLSFFLYVFFVSKFGGTPGKLILKMRIVDQDGDHLSFMDAFKRYGLEFAFMLNSFFQMAQTIKYAPSFTQTMDFENYIKVFNEYGGIYTEISSFLTMAVLMDGFNVFFNPQFRAVHDWWTGSYVVDLKFYKKLQDTPELLQDILGDHMKEQDEDKDETV